MANRKYWIEKGSLQSSKIRRALVRSEQTSGPLNLFGRACGRWRSTVLANVRQGKSSFSSPRGRALINYDILLAVRSLRIRRGDVKITPVENLVNIPSKRVRESLRFAQTPYACSWMTGYSGLLSRGRFFENCKVSRPGVIEAHGSAT